MTLLQILLIIFLLFALSRVVLRFRGGQIKLGEFSFWTLLFTVAIVFVAIPEQSTKLARTLGIGRGVDLIVYASITALFYLVFRIYVMMEDVRHETTVLIRKLALEEERKKNKK